MMKKLLAFLMLLTFAVLPSQAQQIYYAAPNANGGGSSWSDAGDLETMLIPTCSPAVPALMRAAAPMAFRMTCSDCHGM